jgi:hypothetical protein
MVKYYLELEDRYVKLSIIKKNYNHQSIVNSSYWSLPT